MQHTYVLENNSNYLLFLKTITTEQHYTTKGTRNKPQGEFHKGRMKTVYVRVMAKLN